MKSLIESLRTEFVTCFSELFSDLTMSDIEINVPELSDHGDLSLNLALRLSKKLKKNPREIAQQIKDKVMANSHLSKKFKDIQIAGPGFLNFFFSDIMIQEIVNAISKEGDLFGQNESLKGESYLLEYVSANPTGPLTIAHARQAVVGDVLASILERSGAKVAREYYLNDRGVQITILGQSVFARYQQKLGKSIEFPENGYQGDYIKAMAEDIFTKDGKKFETLSIEEGGELLKADSSEQILQTIKGELKEFRVAFDSYFSEKSLVENQSIESCLELLEKRGETYEKDGALWFETTKYGDDKDRVLRKSDGEYTYLSSDIPYHLDKLKRGYTHLIDFMGPDHHGYIARLKASVEALGYSPEALTVLIVQLVTLYRGKEQVHMSTRRGQYVTLRELMDEVGVDAARYFFARRKTDSHLDFDLELAKKQTPDNPVFYVQYAGARISSILKKAKEKYPDSLELDPESFDPELIGDGEKALIKALLFFPETLIDCSRKQEPHRLNLYLEDLASKFQRYYSSGTRVISDSSKETSQKLIVCNCVRKIIENGLKLLKIEIPERM